MDLDEAPASGARAAAVAVAPGGPWGRAFVLDLAARLAGTELELDAYDPQHATLRLGVGDAAEVDLLVAPHPSLLDPGAASVRAGGAVLLQAPALSSEELWGALHPAQRRWITEHDVSVWWIADDGAGAGRLALQGAALAVAAELGVGDRPQDEGEDGLARGARSVRRLDLEATQGTQAATHFGALDTLPRMSEAATPAPASALDVRRFFFNGEAERGAGDPSLRLPLSPAALLPLLDPEDGRYAYPLYVPAGEGDPRPLCELLDDALSGLGDGALVRLHASLLVRVAGEVLRRGADPVGIRTGFDESCEAFVAALDLSDSAVEQLRGELDEIRAVLPQSGELTGPGGATALRLYLGALRAERSTRVKRYREDVGALVRGLQDMLAADHTHAPDASSPEALASSLGTVDLLDAEALSRALPAHRGPRVMARQRRARIESALQRLEAYLEAGEAERDAVLLHGQALPAGLDAGAVEAVPHDEPLAVAVGLFDGRMERYVEVFRATRVARLELHDQYDAQLHDSLLLAMDWRACRDDELAVVPPVLVVDSVERMGAGALGAFSQLLRSGRPIHVVLHEHPARTLDAGSGAATLAVSHREAFVASSTIARPVALHDALRRMTRASRPAVVVVAMPDEEASSRPWLAAQAAHAGRAAPSFRYDPESGPSWAERFDIDGNPDRDGDWPVRAVAYRATDGSEASLELAATFADAVALDPSRRGHFWIVNASAWSDEQMPLAEYLQAWTTEPPRRVPFVWVIDDDGQLQRAVLTRELAVAAWERVRSWRALQELGGVHNEYARRAAEQTRAQVQAEADSERVALQASHSEELDKVARHRSRRGHGPPRRCAAQHRHRGPGGARGAGGASCGATGAGRCGARTGFGGGGRGRGVLRRSVHRLLPVHLVQRLPRAQSTDVRLRRQQAGLHHRRGGGDLRRACPGRREMPGALHPSGQAALR